MENIPDIRMGFAKWVEFLNSVGEQEVEDVQILKGYDQRVVKFRSRDGGWKVLKMAAPGRIRDQKIIREVQTIKRLGHLPFVPKLLRHGKHPCPFFIMPHYSAIPDCPIEKADAHYVEFLTAIHRTRPGIFPRLHRKPARYANWLKGLFVEMELNQGFCSLFPWFRELKTEYSDAIRKDQFIFGQYKPSDLLFSGGDPVFVDWAEGLGYYPIGHSVAILTFGFEYASFDQLDARLRFYQSGLQDQGIHFDPSLLLTWWRMLVLEYSFFLVGKKEFHPVVNTFNSWLSFLTDYHKKFWP